MSELDPKNRERLVYSRDVRRPPATTLSYWDCINPSDERCLPTTWQTNAPVLTFACLTQTNATSGSVAAADVSVAVSGSGTFAMPEFLVSGCFTAPLQATPCTIKWSPLAAERPTRVSYGQVAHRLSYGMNCAMPPTHHAE